MVLHMKSQWPPCLSIRNIYKGTSIKYVLPYPYYQISILRTKSCNSSKKESREALSGAQNRGSGWNLCPVCVWVTLTGGSVPWAIPATMAPGTPQPAGVWKENSKTTGFSVFDTRISLLGFTLTRLQVAYQLFRQWLGTETAFAFIM